MIRVIGVDPSLTALGLGRVIEGVAATSLVKTEPHHGLAELRERIRYLVGQTLRFAAPKGLAVVEAPIMPSGHQGGAVLERAWLYGLLVDQLMVRGPVVQVHPSTRAKYATGSGAAGKDEVLAAMRSRLPDVVIPDHNAADGLALACMGARWLGAPVDGRLGAKQEAAMASVAWPKEGMK